MSSILDRLKPLAVKAETVLPQYAQKITVVIEQKAASEAAALKREAAALENAVTPEVETWLSKLETSIENHAQALAHLFETHGAKTVANAAEGAAKAGVFAMVEGVAETALHAVEAALTPAPAVQSPGSDAIPTGPVL